MTFPSGTPDCCAPEEGCLTGFVSGSSGPTGFPFIIDNSWWKTGDAACCDLLCSGYEGVEDSKDTYIAYVSISDGAGGIIENISGASGLQQPTLTMYECCTNTTTTPPPQQLPRTVQGSYCPCFTTTNTIGITTCSTTTPGTPWSPGTSPVAVECYCCQSGYFNSCNFPFLWDAATCKFTGLLFNNDGYLVSDLQASGEVFFDPCRDKWVVCTNWIGSAGQWTDPTGQCFFAACPGCTGLGDCTRHEGFDEGSYGLYQPESGPGSAAVCYNLSYDCAYPYPYNPCG